MVQISHISDNYNDLLTPLDNTLITAECMKQYVGNQISTTGFWTNDPEHEAHTVFLKDDYWYVNLVGNGLRMSVVDNGQTYITKIGATPGHMLSDGSCLPKAVAVIDYVQGEVSDKSNIYHPQSTNTIPLSELQVSMNLRGCTITPITQNWTTITSDANIEVGLGNSNRLKLVYGGLENQFSYGNDYNMSYVYFYNSWNGTDISPQPLPSNFDLIIQSFTGGDWSADPKTQNFMITFPAPIREPVDCQWLYENYSPVFDTSISTMQPLAPFSTNPQTNYRNMMLTFPTPYVPTDSNGTMTMTWSNDRG
jgi:hypothetical protein